MLGDGDGVGESVSDETAGTGDEVIELKAFVMNIFGVERPVSVLWFVEESGLGHIGSGDMIGEDPRLKLKSLVSLAQDTAARRRYLSVKIFLKGCDGEWQLLLPSSTMSNFLLTDPRGLGLMAIGDMERRVANDRLVGDGDIPYCKRTTLLRLKRMEIS